MPRPGGIVILGAPFVERAPVGSLKPGPGHTGMTLARNPLLVVLGAVALTFPVLVARALLDADWLYLVAVALSEHTLQPAGHRRPIAEAGYSAGDVAGERGFV